MGVDLGNAPDGLFPMVSTYAAFSIQYYLKWSILGWRSLLLHMLLERPNLNYCHCLACSVLFLFYFILWFKVCWSFFIHFWIRYNLQRSLMRVFPSCSTLILALRYWLLTNFLPFFSLRKAPYLTTLLDLWNKLIQFAIRFFVWLQ